MHQQSIQTQGQGRNNLSATGGLLAFLFGAWVGVAASRRYEIPRCQFPYGSQREGEENTEDATGDKRSRKSNWQSRLPPEVREGIEKVKAFERRYRKPENPTAASKETWSSEWTE
ncbi:hypothetical protein ElyMa_002886500 [Elysia marginata]|uniref:Transmembrane protein n=1 Tax=Elysia marginata TaxID=1093978 RepID=A0AAV4HZH9_9GAST|nr:hypothetical protein ElyMa_002886500 [Elysia marginata]